MNMLERLGMSTAGIIKTGKPFESWSTSPVKNWDVSMEMLTIGDLADIAKLTERTYPIEGAYLSKIYLLAKSLITVNGKSVVTEEDLENYNKTHNLVGNQQIDLLGLKVIQIRKWSEAVVNRLAYMYDQMQDEYLTKHLGTPLPDELRAAATDSLNTAEPLKDEEQPDESDISSNNGV